MTYTLDGLVTDCRAALLENGDGLEGVRQAVARALADSTFVETYVANAVMPPERDVIYEEPNDGFCICVHVYPSAKVGSPHDHGPTWAVYGQAEGETEMTDWEIVSEPTGTSPAKVRKAKTYTLKPGDAHAYPVGAVHAPIRRAPTRLLRVEGTNTAKITRTPIIPIDD